MGAGGEVPRERGCHTRSAPGLREGDTAGPERAEPEGQRLEARLGLSFPPSPRRGSATPASLPELALTARSRAEAGAPRDVTNGAAKGRGPCSARPSAPPPPPPAGAGFACAVARASPGGRVPCGNPARGVRREAAAVREARRPERGQRARAGDAADPPPSPLLERTETRSRRTSPQAFFSCLSPPTAPVAQPGRARRRTRVPPGGAGSWRRVPRLGLSFRAGLGVGVPLSWTPRWCLRLAPGPQLLGTP